MKKHLANALTFCRILCSIWMWFSPVFSVPFYAAYLLGGFTDMIDGTVARITGSASDFGARLDSVADLLFTGIAFIKILPVLEIPRWVGAFNFIIAAIRIINLLRERIREGRWIMQHTTMNKVTGFLLFLLPLALPMIELKYSAGIVCAAAMAAALEEGFRIR